MNFELALLDLEREVSMDLLSITYFWGREELFSQILKYFIC